MRSTRFPLILLCGLMATVIGCSTGSSARVPDELYFKVEVEQHGKTVAAPNLLGFEGRHIIVEKRANQSVAPDYRLVLLPSERGDGYGVHFDLVLPSGHRAGTMQLLSGEERRVLLDEDTSLKLLVMRVDSPEFRALMMRAGKKPNQI
jgi:hypothetical protein